MNARRPVAEGMGPGGIPVQIPVLHPPAASGEARGQRLLAAEGVREGKSLGAAVHFLSGVGTIR